MNPTIEDDRLQDYRTDPAQTYHGARLQAPSYEALQAAIDAARLQQEAEDRRLIQKIADNCGCVAEYPADLRERTLETLLAKVTSVDLSPISDMLVTLQDQIAAMRVKATFVTADTSSELGTRCIISGGEAMEIDAPTTGSDEQIPF